MIFFETIIFNSLFVFCFNDKEDEEEEEEDRLFIENQCFQ